MAADPKLVKESAHAYRKALLDGDVEAVKKHLDEGANPSYVEGHITTKEVVDDIEKINGNCLIYHAQLYDYEKDFIVYGNIYDANKMPNAPLILVIKSIRYHQKNGQPSCLNNLLSTMDLLIDRGADPNFDLSKFDSHHDQELRTKLNIHLLREMFALFSIVRHQAKLEYAEVHELGKNIFKKLLAAGIDFHADCFGQNKDNVMFIVNDMINSKWLHAALNIVTCQAQAFSTFFEKEQRALKVRNAAKATATIESLTESITQSAQRQDLAVQDLLNEYCDPKLSKDFAETGVVSTLEATQLLKKLEENGDAVLPPQPLKNISFSLYARVYSTLLDIALDDSNATAAQPTTAAKPH